MRIGVDLGGTKIEVAAIDEAGTVVDRVRRPTPRDDYDGTIEAIAALVDTVETRLGRRCTVGVAMPGALSPATGRIKNANSTWLIGRPFDADLARRLDRPVRLQNDANCLALSEAVDGAAAGAGVVFAVILGTGVGGGLVVGERLIEGRNAIAGEWGHNPLPWPAAEELPGPTCYCGLKGCIETFLSGPALARDHLSATGRSWQVPAILDAAAAGDDAAEAALRRYENRLARAFASVINILDPDVIVLGGGLSNLGRLYDHIPALWSNWAFSDRVDTRLVQARHGDSSGVRGAARLWLAGASPP
ncbi:MAG: fructokinase [Rhodospirillaceae bacterium]|nr:fructokinase [Rhodospirillaceae bacterium]